MYEARIERDSITQYGERLTTFVVTLPRIVLAELNTHKMISKSSASSRAIPVQKQIDRLYLDPFEPVYWGKNQKGMQALEELTESEIAEARQIWKDAMYGSIKAAELLVNVGVHKQISNRVLECFMWHTVILSATDLSNFFHLRDHKAAQPEIQKAAGMMSEIYRASRPKLLLAGQWSLPFIDEATMDSMPRDIITNTSIETAVRSSVGCTARVSYNNHDGKRDIEDDLRLAATLHGAGHMAPYEHVARPMTEWEREIFKRDEWVPEPKHKTFTGTQDPTKGYPSALGRWIATGKATHYLGNFNGWVQARKLIFGEHDALGFER